MCGEILFPDEEGACDRCKKTLSYVEEPLCRICGREIYNESDALCSNCEEHRFSFEYSRSIINYDDKISESLAQIKYKNKLEYLYFFTDCIEKRGKAIIDAMNPQAFLFVPVHKKRLRKRGFNQAEVIAREMSRIFSIPCLDLLGRKKETRAMKNLGSHERFHNLKDAFYLKTENIKKGLPRSVCIVDDIFTTGATMDACSTLALENGIEKVYGFTLFIRSMRP